MHLVTVLYNSEDSLSAFLHSLWSQAFRDWRLVAVDNASRDRSHEVVAAAAAGDSRITLVRNAANLGFAKAANQNLRAAAAGGDFFVLLNPDTAFGPAFLGDLIARRDALRAPVLAPRIMRLGHPGEAWYAGGHLDDGWVFRNVHEPYRRRPAPPLAAAARRGVEVQKPRMGFAPAVLTWSGLALTIRERARKRDGIHFLRHRRLHWQPDPQG